MDLEQQVEALLDRAAIEDVLRRYARGIDRMDVEMAKSVYWEDSTDDHQAYIGSGKGLVDWANELHSGTLATWQHYMTQTYIDLEGDVAHTETYYVVVGRKKDSNEVHMSGGRNIDRMEKRDGRWAIAARINTTEWCLDPDLMGQFIGIQAHLAKDPSDPSYMRPLKVERDPRVIPFDFGAEMTSPGTLRTI
jgi:ketosteroid isomerase-like protein